MKIRTLLSSLLLGSLVFWTGSANSMSPIFAPTVDANLIPTSISTSNPVTQEVRLVVKLKERRVYVYRGKTQLEKFAIAVGKKGWETPTGNHKVINKDVYPTFKNFKTGVTIEGGDRDNPLNTQIGFHGTNQPELIGKAVSHGCIRMHNKDVIKLYDYVAIGTPVIVQP
jgi:L,D-transpeptidase ErfK/SrfK